ncbi:VOC family protein [Segnochrobactraceae bacterium EtOH-i3]
MDHIGFLVTDLDRARAFYEAALAQLGLGLQMEVPAGLAGPHAHLGYGEGGKPFFWITGGADGAGLCLHVAFAAGSRAEVDAFYAAALAAGGRDNGPPGLRLHYHPHYYAAFVRDPDGHNIEAVCHRPE